MIEKNSIKKKTEVQFNGELVFNSVTWKNQNISSLKNEFDDRLKDIKGLYEDLMEEVYWNELIYSTEIRFEPVVGETYHLYQRDDSSYFLSIIGPNEWNMNFINSFKLKHNKMWKIC